jgi:hypothetical protein
MERERVRPCAWCGQSVLSAGGVVRTPCGGGGGGGGVGGSGW